MHAIPDLLDLAKIHSKLPSDRQLGIKVGVVSQQISQWRHGTHVPKGEHATQLARLCGLTEDYVLICIQHATAKHDEVRRILRHIAGQVAQKSAAAIALIALFSSGLIAHPSIATAHSLRQVCILR